MKAAVSLVTCGSGVEARKIARTLVREKLAACVNVVGGVTSVFVWKGKAQEDREWLLIIKSRAALSRKLAARIRKLHSYKVPEIITLNVAAGDPDYLKWLGDSTR